MYYVAGRRRMKMKINVYKKIHKNVHDQASRRKPSFRHGINLGHSENEKRLIISKRQFQFIYIPSVIKSRRKTPKKKKKDVT